MTGFRGGGAQRWTTALDRRTRAGRSLVRRDVGVATHRRHLVYVEPELFAGDLQHASGISLAHLDLAEIDRCGVVGMDRDPGIDRPGIRRTGYVAAGGCGGQHARQAEADDEGAAPLEQVAS